MTEFASLLSEARARIRFIKPLASTIGMSDPNYGQLIDDASLVSARVEELEEILRELCGGYDDFYSSGNFSRILNVESMVRGLFPPLGS